MDRKVKKRFILFRWIFISILGISSPVMANSDWEVSFSFDNPGGRPSASTMRNYMMGCVPAGSFVPNPPPPSSPEGPFSLTTPAVGGRELTDAEVYNYLDGCNLKPASVTGIAVLGED